MGYASEGEAGAVGGGDGGSSYCIKQPAFLGSLASLGNNLGLELTGVGQNNRLSGTALHKLVHAISPVHPLPQHGYFTTTDIPLEDDGLLVPLVLHCDISHHTVPYFTGCCS